MLFTIMSAAALSFAPCFLPGLSQQAECATLTVPAVHQSVDAQSPQQPVDRAKTLSLHIARIPAQASGNAPLVYLPGGPGQSGSDTAAIAAGMLAAASRDRDLILIDYRGTGRSGALQCAVSPDEFGANFGVQDDDPQAFAAIQDCADTLSATTNLDWYTTTAIADDLDWMREALGAPQLNLYGGSYGTRVALEYMRRYPTRVRAAVLDGVAPIGWAIGGSMGVDAQSALDTVLGDCAAQPSCAEAFPAIRDTLPVLLARLDEAPDTVTFAHPATGQATEFVIGADEVALAIRGVLYSETLSRLLPLQIDAAAHGDHASLQAASYSFTEGLMESISLGLMLSVLCAEDIASLPEQAAQSERNSFIGSGLWDYWKTACTIWPVAEVPPAFYEPVQSEIPSLLLSGTWDPVTPPSNGERATQHLSNSLHITVPGNAHITARRGCLPQVVAEFYAAGTSEGLDTTCVSNIQPPRFLTTALGAPPDPAKQATGDTE